MRDAYSALSHPVRRKILFLLRAQRMSAGEIAGHFDISKPTLSGHFAVLKEAGLVTCEREGTTIWYKINNRGLQDVITKLMEMVSLDEAEKDPCHPVHF